MKDTNSAYIDGFIKAAWGVEELGQLLGKNVLGPMGGAGQGIQNAVKAIGKPIGKLDDAVSNAFWGHGKAVAAGGLGAAGLAGAAGNLTSGAGPGVQLNHPELTGPANDYVHGMAKVPSTYSGILEYLGQHKPEVLAGAGGVGLGAGALYGMHENEEEEKKHEQEVPAVTQAPHPLLA